MANFFRLNSNEIKEVRKEQYIYSDTLIITNNTSFSFSISSKAPTLRIKMNIEVLKLDVGTLTTVTRYYNVSKYVELENKQVFTHLFEYGTMGLQYSITKTNDTYNVVFNVGDKGTFYCSSIIFEDSFYDDSKGWLNSNNPSNLINLIQLESNYNLREARSSFKETEIIDTTTNSTWRWFEKVYYGTVPAQAANGVVDTTIATIPTSEYNNDANNVMMVQGTVRDRPTTGGGSIYPCPFVLWTSATGVVYLYELIFNSTNGILLLRSSTSHTNELIVWAKLTIRKMVP